VDLLFVSVERNIENFARNSVLTVRFYVPSQSTQQASFFLEAFELQDSMHYYMQAVNQSWTPNTWTSFTPWPTKDVIDDLCLDAVRRLQCLAPINIGVSAWYRVGKGEPVYLPVEVFSNSAPPRSSLYTFHIVPGRDLQRIEVAVLDEAGMPRTIDVPQLACNLRDDPECVMYPAGTAIAFSIDFRNLPNGMYQISLIGHSPGSADRIPLRISIYHHA